MLSYRLGTDNDFHWEFKPVLSYSKPFKKFHRLWGVRYLSFFTYTPSCYWGSNIIKIWLIERFGLSVPIFGTHIICVPELSKSNERAI